MPLCRIHLHPLPHQQIKQSKRPSSPWEMDVRVGGEMINIHHMICPHHTPPGSIISHLCRVFCFHPSHNTYSFNLEWLPELHSLQSLAPVWRLFIPSQLWPISGVVLWRIISLVLIHVCLFYHTCQAKFANQFPQWDISASTPGGENHTTWTLVPCKSMATDAGPPELLINPFTCLQLISSLVSLNLHPVGLKPSHVWTSQLEEQIISLLSNWSVWI